MYQTEAIPDVLRQLGSSLLSDALRDVGFPNYTAAPGIAPINRSDVTAGPVRTSTCARAGTGDLHSFLPLATFIDSCESGDVLVFGPAEGASAGSVWGSICTAAALSRGCAGVIIDGFMRDTLDIAATALPVFSRGALAQDCLGRSMVAETNADIVCGGVRVQPGDWVVADVDGVVFIPAKNLEDAIYAAGEKRQKEQLLLEAVRSGSSLTDAVGRLRTL